MTTDFNDAQHAVTFGRVLEHLRKSGVSVRPVFNTDSEYTKKLEIEIGFDRTEWVELIVSAWRSP